MQTAQFQLHAEIEQRHWWFVARRQILSAVIQAVLPPDRSTTIVDVGCGTGANLAGLADRYSCVGIDVSADAIALAQTRFPQVRFVQGLAPGDLGDWMPQARLIMANDVLEHVADDFQLFSELLAAASPGTYFLLTVPADMSLWSGHDEAFGHYRRYDLERFEQIWQGLPVQAIFASYFNRRLHPIVKAIRTFNRWRDATGGAAGTDFRIPSVFVNQMLTRCFAGEQQRLARLAHGQSAARYSHGVSLMALLMREPGAVAIRHTPPSLSQSDRRRD